MPQSLAQIYLHLVFSTKNRVPFVSDWALQRDMHTYLTSSCRSLDAPALSVGGVADHVHILCYMSRLRTVADLVRDLKRKSSRWIKTKESSLIDFHWQEGYGAFSISPSHVESLRRYIANQAEHHRTETFQEEYRRLLKKYGVEFDERHVWD